MKNKIIWIFLFIFTACSSVPVKTENADLVGIVIDENNQPVKDFVVKCKGELGVHGSGITDEKGLFVISDIKFGVLKIEGKRSGYSIYRNDEFNFFKHTNIFCIQVSSADKVLENASDYITTGELVSAKNCIDCICTDKNEYLEKICNEYLKFINGGENEIDDVE